MKKRLFVFFFIVLVFHVGLVIPKTKFECSCSLFSPEEFSPCCNCPHCVSKRGGFLSACSCHERTEKPLGDIPLIKRVACFCGSATSDFDLPGLKYPALLSKDLFAPPVLEIHPYFQVPSTLSSQVYLTPPDHPS
jgi:hypothetical protein